MNVMIVKDSESGNFMGSDKVNKKDSAGAEVPEYSVYIYHHQEEGAPQQWERKHNTQFVDQAIKRAKILYKSDKYAKVEVKKIEMDERKQQAVESSCKVYQASRLDRYMMQPNLLMKLVFAALSVSILGALLYLAVF